MRKPVETIMRHCYGCTTIMWCSRRVRVPYCHNCKRKARKEAREEAKRNKGEVSGGYDRQQQREPSDP